MNIIMKIRQLWRFPTGYILFIASGSELKHVYECACVHACVLVCACVRVRVCVCGQEQRMKPQAKTALTLTESAHSMLT